MRYLLGIDIGTSGTKTLIMDETGNVLASNTSEYPLSQPQNGWAEQDPEDWWNAVKITCKKVMADSGISKSDVAGIGLSGQMHGLVMLDKDNRVIRPSIIWCDQRTAAECEEITQRVGAQRLMEITCNPALTGFTASKILWVRNHEPENYAKCCKILLPKDYIRFKLTGEYATEVSDASGMQLLDIANRCWSREVLEKLEIDENLLGKVYESPEITGYTTAQAGEDTGLVAGIPVVGGGGDNAASAIGMGIVHDGSAFLSVGTSGVLFAHTDEMSMDPKGRIHTFCCAVPGAWHVMGVTQGAGLSLQWFRNQCCEGEIAKAKELGKDPYYLMDKEAEAIPVGSDRLIYMPYLMGERTPHLDPDCRGVFFGLSAMHQRAHMIRAVLEGVGYSMKDCQSVFDAIGANLKETAICGGGATSPLWRKILCDILDIPVYTVKRKDGGAYGAAILASVGAGVYGTVQEACDTMITRDERTEPSARDAEEYKKYYKLYTELYPAMKDSFTKLAKL